MRDLIYVRGRDPDFAAAMFRAERGAEPKPPPEHPLDPVARTRSGAVIRRNGERANVGPLFDLESLPLVDP